MSRKRTAGFLWEAAVTAYNTSRPNALIQTKNNNKLAGITAGRAPLPHLFTTPSRASSSASPGDNTPFLLPPHQYRELPMGLHIDTKLLDSTHEKTDGIEEGGFSQIINPATGEPVPDTIVMHKSSGKIRTDVREELEKKEKSTSGKKITRENEHNNIAANKEVVIASLFQKYIKENKLGIIIPSTGIWYEIDPDTGALTEGVLSKIIHDGLEPPTLEPHDRYFSVMTEEIYGSDLIKQLHKMIPIFAITRSYDFSGSSMRNMGIVEHDEGQNLVLWDFGVGLGVTPPTKEWFLGELRDVIRAFDRIRGIEEDGFTFTTLSDPREVDNPHLVSSQNLARSIMMTAPLSSFTNAQLLNEKDIESSFDIFEKIPRATDREINAEYIAELEKKRNKHETLFKERQEECREMCAILEEIYPRAEFDHDNILLPPLQFVRELYREGMEAEQIREAVDKITPADRIEQFNNIYNTVTRKAIGTHTALLKEKEWEHAGGIA